MLTEDLFEGYPIKEETYSIVEIDDCDRYKFSCECNGCQFRNQTKKFLVPIFFIGIFCPPILLLNCILTAVGFFKSFQSLKGSKNFYAHVKDQYYINIKHGNWFICEVKESKEDNMQRRSDDISYFKQVISECSSITEELHWRSIKEFRNWNTISFSFFLIECIIIALAILLAFTSTNETQP